MPGPLDVQQLAKMALFEGLTPLELTLVSESLRRRTFPPCTNVICVETPGEIVYVIEAGTVKIRIHQADGREVIVAVLGPGEVVGELSIIDDIGRSADVVTQETTTLLWVDRNCFERLMEHVPRITHNLLRVLSRRVRASTQQIQALCTLDVYGKVARQLLVFARQYGESVDGKGLRIPIRLTQSDIAGMVGASRERVNQVFVNLRDRKLIEFDAQSRTTILDIDRLRDIVEQR